MAGQKKGKGDARDREPGQSNEKYGIAEWEVQTEGKTQQQYEVVTSVVDIVVCEDDWHVRLTNETIIPEKWLDIREWFAGKKAPKEWVERMARSGPQTRSKMEVCNEEILGVVIYV